MGLENLAALVLLLLWATLTGGVRSRIGRMGADMQLEVEATQARAASVAALAAQFRAASAGLAQARTGRGADAAAGHHARRLPPAERRGLYCYTLVRTPVEATAALWRQQAEAACDGWDMFSHQADDSKGVVAAYTEEEEKHGWQHQQEDMTLRGAWKHMAETGDLWKYAWVVKMDSDAFLRPSSLKPSLARYNHTLKQMVSVSNFQDRGATAIEGWFTAVPAALADEIYPYARTDGQCNPKLLYELVSGHNEEGARREEEEERVDCMDLVGFDPGRDVQAFKNDQGELLTAQDEDWHTGQALQDKCRPMSQAMLAHALQTGVAGQPLCGCKPGGSHVEQCIGRDVVIVHPVKDVETYRRLMAHLA